MLDEQAAERGAEDGGEDDRHADHAHHARHVRGPAALTRIIWPIGISRPPPEALQHARGDERLERPGEAAERGAGGEEHQRDDVEAAGAEAGRGPAGDRDHGGEREHVAGDDPLDAVERGVELLRESVSSATLTIVVARTDMIAPRMTAIAMRLTWGSCLRFLSIPKV